MNSAPLRKIVVLGGGTAGWLTALMALQAVPNATVTIIESDEIGILGAGEGTTPKFVSAMEFLKIPTSRIVREASGTLKTAIKFTGWGEDWKDGGHFYHGFDLHDEARWGEIRKMLGKYSINNLLSSYNDVYAGDLDITASYNNLNKTPFIKFTDASSFPISDPIENYDDFSNFAMHFDAKKLAELFKLIAVDERGALRIEGKAVGFNEGSSGKIDSVELDSGETVECDFLFDCSGFARLAIGKHYKSEWVPYKNLPAKRALPFFIDFEEGENPPAYTEAITMEYGWMWKIPVEGRYGCGYVYDSDYIDDIKASKEIEKFLGFEPKYPRKEKGSFKFEAGYFKTPWTGNVISVGLSSGFIEPMEATSIWACLYALENALANPWEMFNANQIVIDEFNKKMLMMNSEVADFIYLHYMCSRDDTEFWKGFKDVEKAPDRIKTLIKKWAVSIPKDENHHSKFFGYASWWQMAYGLNWLNKDLIKSMVIENNLLEFQEHWESFRIKTNEFVKTLPDHKEILKVLGKVPKKKITI